MLAYIKAEAGDRENITKQIIGCVGDVPNRFADLNVYGKQKSHMAFLIRKWMIVCNRER